MWLWIQAHRVSCSQVSDQAGVVISGAGGGTGKKRKVGDASETTHERAATDDPRNAVAVDETDGTKKKNKGLRVTESAKQRLDEMDRERKNLKMKSKWVGGPATDSVQRVPSL